MERVKSGIAGLDDALEGGFPPASIVLIVGGPGTGKTTFSMQFLFNGASDGEAGIYMMGISEPLFSVKRMMSRFGFFDEKLIEDGMIKFWDFGAAVEDEGPNKALLHIMDYVKKNTPKRIVIDPLPLSLNFPSILEYRKYLYRFFMGLRKQNVLTLITGEDTPGPVRELEAYMADGVIDLELRPLDNPLEYNNLLRIKKMRGTKHTRNILTVDISTDGMRVHRVGRIV